jgi:Zn-dependent protease
MKRSWKLGEAFGIPVFVHWSFLLLPVLVLLQTMAQGPVAVALGIALVLAVFGCVVLHEFGHALMARYFGIGTRDITLYPIGGVASLEGLGRGPGEELAIALAGPAVNLVLLMLLSPAILLALVTGALAGGLTLPAGQGILGLGLQFLALLGLSNFMLLAFNLLPAFPMDGGRVLRALLSTALPRLRATEIAARVGLIMAGLFVIAAFFWKAPMLAVLAVFVGFAGQAELAAMRRAEQPEPLWQTRVAPEVETVRIPPFYPWGDGGPTSPRGFSGFAFDPETGAWVRWQDGRPVQVFTG